MKSVLLIVLLALPLAARADVISPNETPQQRDARIRARNEHYREMLEEQKRAAEEAKHPKPKQPVKPAPDPLVDPDLKEAMTAQLTASAIPLASLTILGLLAVVLLYIRRRRTPL